MHRPLILGLLFSLVSFAAHAACPGNPPTCGNPMMSEAAGSVMYATGWGVQADGITSDDVALKAAVDACAAKGTKLILPPGQILLTGAATISLQSCGIVGAGAPAGDSVSPASMGTTVLLTSRTVNPFICRLNWSITGVNFYWPNQTSGTQVYKPLISDDKAARPGIGTDGCGHAYLDHVVIVNAYDGIVGAGNWGDVIFSNSTMYAVHDMFAFASTGDSFAFTNMRFTPGPWLHITGFSSGTNSALNEADKNNTLFHVLAQAGGGGMTVSINNSETEAWRWGIKIDSGGLVAASYFNLLWDGTGTLIDTSAGGVYAPQNVFSGSNSFCGSPRWDKTAVTAALSYPCFIMNNQSGLFLQDFSGGAGKDFVVMDGGSLTMANVGIAGIASVADGSDYFLVKVTAGNPQIYIRNSTFSGHALAGPTPDPHARGIVTSGHTPLRLVVQNNFFIYFNEAINADTSAGTNLITGNASGSEAATSITLNGTNGVLHANNQWQNPPRATCTGCNPGYFINGAMRGTIHLAGGAAITAFTLHLPWVPYGEASCQFNPEGSGVTIGGTASGKDVSVTISTNIVGGLVAFDCLGAQ